MEQENINMEEVYSDIVEDIQSMVTAVSQIINDHEKMKDKNFCLYYQHGRLGYLDLDEFAKNVDVKGMQEKINTESKKELDKNEE